MTQFTHLDIRAHLVIPAGTEPGQARRALEKAERGCLISISLKATVHLESAVAVAAEHLSALTSVGQ